MVGGAHGLLILGLRQASIPGVGGTFLIDPSWMRTLPLPMGAAPGQAGAGSASIPLPPDVSAIKGLTIFLQSVFLDSAGPDGYTLSNGAQFAVF